MGMLSNMELVDIQALIDEFVADSVRSSMELPHMTTGQRKQTKKTLEQHPELRCESYGFGQERKLHLFKGEASSVVNMPTEASVAPSCPDPAPATPLKNALQCVMDGEVGKLDLASIKEANAWCQTSPPEASTAAPSTNGSPASTFRGTPLPSWFRLPPGLELEVQNTFIHYKTPPVVNSRSVQSMPHNMFRQCLLEEVEAAKVSDGAVEGRNFGPLLPTALFEDMEEELTAGTVVVIEGLAKMPAFNGQWGTVECFDDATGRYQITLSAQVCGHKTAKIKRDNFRLLTPTETFHLGLECTDASQPLRLNALV